MKITKLSLLALSFGLFAASCGDTNEEVNDADTMMVAPVETAPMTPDTMMAAPATTDTMMTNTTTTTTTDTMVK